MDCPAGFEFKKKKAGNAFLVETFPGSEHKQIPFCFPVSMGAPRAPQGHPNLPVFATPVGDREESVARACSSALHSVGLTLL